MPDDPPLSKVMTEPRQLTPDPYVLFATPTLTGSVAYEFAGSMEQVGGLLAQAGIRSAHRYQPGLQFIEVARNLLVATFLQDYPEATDLFFIDDDIGFTPHKVIEFVMRQEPVLAGAPPMKSEGPPQFPVFLCSNDGAPIESEGLFLAQSVPCGFLRLKRELVEALAINAQTYQWITVENAEAPVVFKLFDRGDINGEFLGEDVMFCRMLRQQNIPIWVDADIKFTHRGSRRWEGSFSDALESYRQGTNKVARVREIR